MSEVLRVNISDSSQVVVEIFITPSNSENDASFHHRNCLPDGLIINNIYTNSLQLAWTNVV